MPNVELTRKYATSVDSLPEAWAFVMRYVDSVGEDPTININPFWTSEARRFEVVVSGIVDGEVG